MPRGPRGVLTRRSMLKGALAATAIVNTACRHGTTQPKPNAASVPLPSAAQVRADVQRMVDFGPRLTGSEAHTEWCSWLVDQMQAAGLHVEPCDDYAYQRYEAKSFTLEVLDGRAPRTPPIIASYVRSVGTPPEGVTGPLVLAEGFPQLPDLEEAFLPSAYTAAVQQWVANVPPGSLRGSILLIDLATPARLTASVFTGIAAYLQWDGHTLEDWRRLDYTRLWLGPWPDLRDFTALDLKGIVLSTRSSRAAATGTYSPFMAHPQPIPALIVDRDTGAALRQRAANRPQARLTLLSEVKAARLRQITAVLPGASEECIIVNTHTDGQNAFEENGGVAAVALARHFAGLPARQRLRRTLVFALYPGHMSGQVGIQNARGWALEHPDFVRKAVAAVSIEHLGAREWIDDPVRGYSPTGESEIYAVWTTQGPLLSTIAKPALVASRLQRHGLLKPPTQITPGAVFHWLGVPHVSGIAGPTYLMTVSRGGEMDKLDPGLAARQIAFYGDIIRRLDTADAAALRTGDPTLGHDEGSPAELAYRDTSAAAPCLPA